MDSKLIQIEFHNDTFLIITFEHHLMHYSKSTF